MAAPAGNIVEFIGRELAIFTGEFRVHVMLLFGLCDSTNLADRPSLAGAGDHRQIFVSSPRPVIVARRLQCRFRTVGEKAMQCRHHLRALADCAADALDRAGADVADREHAGHRGFQQRNRTLAILSVLDAG
jgi:hypothetical protein